jgi:AraC-like DNA-binding protein
MPFAPQIRKQILQALNNHIVPALHTAIIPQVWAGPPFDFQGYNHPQVQRIPYLPAKKTNPLDVVVHWENEQVSARRMSQLAFSYHGASEEKIGVTRELARELKVGRLPGLTSLQLVAPAAFYVPANVPHGGMAWGEKEYGPLRMVVALFTQNELLLRHFDSAKGGSHHICVGEPSFKEMELRYAQLLQQGDSRAAQRQLLTFMQNLSDYLAHHETPLSNSSWPPLEDTTLSLASHITPRNAQLCRQAIDYIQFHLYTSLTVGTIAQACGVSDAHLNRTFRQNVGVPIMHFVTYRRLRAVELMLADGDERISDIARLAGFASSHSLAVVFHRHSGMSPTQYRKKYKSE